MKATSQRSPSVLSSRSRRRSYRNVSGQHLIGPVFARINKLAENGKTEALVRVVADQLPALAQNRLSAWTDRQARHYRNASESLLGLIKAKSLEDELVAEVRTRLLAEQGRSAADPGYDLE